MHKPRQCKSGLVKLLKGKRQLGETDSGSCQVIGIWLAAVLLVAYARNLWLIFSDLSNMKPPFRLIATKSRQMSYVMML